VVDRSCQAGSAGLAAAGFTVAADGSGR